MKTYSIYPNRWAVLSSVLLGLLQTSGCKIFESYVPPAVPSGEMVRVINLAYFADPTYVKVDTNSPNKFVLPYRASSGYFQKAGGVYSLETYGAKDLPGYNPKAIKVAYGKNTTAFLFTNPGHLPSQAINQVYYFVDSTLTAPVGRASVKVLNFSDSYGSNNSQLYVWFGATDINSPGAFRFNSSGLGIGAQAIINDVARDHTTIFTAAGGAKSLAAGSYPVTLGYYITQSSTAGLIQLQSRYKPVQLADGSSYTAVITGTKDPTDNIPFQVVFYNDQDNSTQVLQEDVVVSLTRYVHAAYNVSDSLPDTYHGLDFKLDGQLQVHGLKYGPTLYRYGSLDSSSLGYTNSVPVGAHRFTVTPNGAFGPVLAGTDLNIPDGTSYTLFAAPHEVNSNAIDLVPIQDSNSSAEGGKLKLRVVNMSPSPQLAAVDVFISTTFTDNNGNTLSFSGLLASNLKFQHAGGYNDLYLPLGTHMAQLSLRMPNNGPAISGTLQYIIKYPDNIYINTIGRLNASYTVVITGELNASDPRKKLQYRLYLDKTL